MRNAIIYARISRDRVGAGLGVDRQRKDCLELAQRLGLQVVAVYSDNDLSAYSGKPRPGYRRMLADLQTGRATAVLAWHTDRLHRSPRELEEYIDLCERYGVATHTVKAGPLDLATPSGRLIARQLGAHARFESEHQSERARRQKEQMARTGQWMGGRRPFGYEADGVTVRPSEAAALRQAAEEILAGRSVISIVKEWNQRGITTTAGNRWSITTLRRMLLRARNAGLMEHRGEVVGPAEWPAIIDEPTWRALVAVLGDPGRRTTPGPGRRWLGSGIYECGVCEQEGNRDRHGRVYRLIAASSGMGGKGGRSSVPAYRCSKERGHVTRNAEHLDRYVEMVAVEWLSQPGAVDAFLTRGDDSTAKARALEREAIRAREQEAAELFATGQITAAQLATMNATWAARLAELDRLDAATARTSALVPFRGRNAGEARQVWETLDLDRRRAVINEIMRVIVLPAKRGRPKGWTPEYGREWGYFDPASIRIERRDHDPRS